MASTISHLRHVATISNSLSITKPTPRTRTTATFPTRRQSLLLLLPAALVASSSPARAQDIGLFGIRKKIEKAEEEIEEVVKEGVEAAEKGLESAEKGLESAEELVEKEVSFGGLAQASAVVGAEVVGILVATSIVNGILGPEAQKS